MCVSVCACTEFPSFKLVFPMQARAVVYKALLRPRFRMCRDSFDFLSDGRNNERCEGAGKTALR